MPILVRWKWEEKTKSFLVIFYFYDNFSRPNLRFVEKELIHFRDLPHASFFNIISNDENKSESISNPVKMQLMTWAPSHRELALLSDLLHYANVISGLPEAIRRDLRYDLEIFVTSGNDLFNCDEKTIENLDQRFRSPSILVGREKNKEGIMETILCTELSSEYLDYLRDTIKPYI